MQFYGVLYIHGDNPEQSDILGLFKDFEKAVDELVERANYRENADGQLTQYFQVTQEYDSLEALKSRVRKTLRLVDVDTYRIIPVRVL
jgi:hypothetical protein